MSNNSFAKMVHRLSLNRNEDYMYTTGDSKIDKSFGLGHEVVYGNPSMDSQINFGALVYLSGLFGGKCTNFTATPFGYLYEMDFDGKKGLHIVAENESTCSKSNFLGFNIEHLIGRIEEYKGNHHLNNNENYFCDFVIVELKSADKNTMLAILQNVSSLIKSNPTLFSSFESNLNDARLSYKTTNDKNCDRNRDLLHLIVENAKERNIEMWQTLEKQLVIDMQNLGVDQLDGGGEIMSALNDLGVSDEDKFKVNQLLSKIYQNEDEFVTYKETTDWIIQGYFTHCGYDRELEKVEQDKGIINKRAIDKNSKYRKIFGQDLKKILNLCSTDYTADRVYDVVSIYADSNINDIESGKALDKVLDAVETAKDNKQAKFLARKSFTHGEALMEK